ncbi:unc-112-related protein-like [Photinus pyralis]|uniref:unc-112-related protein-like n=1 Tax=Photinus pyralis TaxID=7054 RepID=UPI001267663C|nr:unc-112-related protein-like [Photinus pyralis]
MWPHIQQSVLVFKKCERCQVVFVNIIDNTYYFFYQLQVALQTGQPQPNFDNGNLVFPNEDDIDAALTDLQTTLEGSTINSQTNDITQVPELYDELRFLKPKRFTLKAFKKYWFTCRDLHLYLYKSREEMIHHGNPAHSINLKGCEVTPDVNISQNKYGIKLEVPSSEGMSEMYIRCDNVSARSFM